MAQVKTYHGGDKVLLPESEQERGFLAFAEQHGSGEVVLDEALYPVRDGEVGLPEGIRKAALQRVKLALEGAAAAHAEAVVRRGQLRVL